MDFRPNITPVEMIKKGALGGTYVRDIYSSLTDKNPWRDFKGLKDIDQKYYCSNYYDSRANKYGVKCRKSLTF